MNEIGFSDVVVSSKDTDSVKGNQVFTEQRPNNELLAMLGFVGGFKGQLLITFPDNVTNPFVALLLQHLEMPQGDESAHQMTKEAIAEFTNQLGGSFVNQLSLVSIDCMITPPTILTGNGVQAMLPESDQDYYFGVSGNFGNFTCILAVKNSKLI